MTESNFLSYLQQLLSMIKKDDEYSVALAYTALTATIQLVHASGKADGRTYRSMMRAKMEFQYLADHCDEFAGIPGEFKENQRRRSRLLQMIRPGC